MEKRLSDGLMGWAGGIAAWVLFLMFVGSGVSALILGMYLVIVPMAEIPGFLGGYLGGRFLEFYGSNFLCGAFFTSLVLIFTSYWYN